MGIDAKEINTMFLDCLFKPDEIPGDGVMPEGSYLQADGIVGKYGFHPERTRAKAERLAAIVEELDPNFLSGWTFLNLPFDKFGDQWGEQPNANELMCMCMANGLARYQFPRDMWGSLPGGMPYVQFATEPFQA